MNDCILLIATCDISHKIRKTLEAHNYKVILVSHVGVALGMLTTASYDLVVADLDLLRRTGGDDQTSHKLSMLLYHTHNIPVVLGCSGPQCPYDLVDLCDPQALLQCIRDLKGEYARERLPIDLSLA